MKKLLFSTLASLLFTLQVIAQTPFITIWSATTEPDTISITPNGSFTYDFDYVWKDSLDNIITSGTHTSADGVFVTGLPLIGEYTLEITGDFPHLTGYTKTELQDVIQWGDIVWESFNSSFRNWSGTGFSSVDTPDLSNVTTMSQAFRDASNFNDDISDWDVSNVLGFVETFDNANRFNQNLGSWNLNTSGGINCARMFESANDFEGLGLDLWNVQNVTRFNDAFDGTSISSETYEDILISWAEQDLRSNVQMGIFGKEVCETEAEFAREAIKNEFNWAFGDGGTCNEATNILSFEIANEQVGETVLDTANHTITLEVFSNADITALTPSIVLSEGASSNPAIDIEQDFTNQVIYSVTAENGTTTLDWTVNVVFTDQQPFITSWSAVVDESITIELNEDFDYNFNYSWKDAGDNELTSGRHTSADGDFVTPFTSTAEVTLEIIGDFPHFQNYPKDQLLDVQEWGEIVWGSMVGSFSDWNGAGFSAEDNPDLSQVTDMSQMFIRAGSFNDDINDWDVGNVTTMVAVFREAFDFNRPLNGWDVSNVINMGVMFENANNFNQDLNSWQVGKVTDMSRMFNGADNFNGDISIWNVENVTSMSEMFESAGNFNGDISTWHVENVTNMSNMFRGAGNFNSDISNWNVIKVTRMVSMFQGAIDFNADISDWHVDNVTLMNQMFQSADAFNQDISGWNVGKVENMSEMFLNADAIDQDLGAWNVSQVTNMENMFNGSGLSPQNYDNILIAWAALDNLQPNVPLGASGITFCKSAAARAILTDPAGLNWTINDDGEFCSPETDILSFVLTDQAGEATIDAVNHTISIEVLFTSVLDTLAPQITLSAGASSTPAPGEVLDFTDPVTYMVTAEDEVTVQDWIATLSVAPPSAETDILTFAFAEQTGDAVINAVDHTVDIEVVFGTDISVLIPEISLSLGATSNPANGGTIDFTNEVTFTVTAQDETTTQAWTIRVTIAPNTETDITAFTLTEQTGPARINTIRHTVAVEVVLGTDITTLSPMFTLSEGASSIPSIGEVLDFTNPIIYTVTAQDGVEIQDWTVTVSEEILNTETDIISFVLSDQTRNATINPSNHTISVEVGVDANITALSPMLTLSEGATSDPASGETVNFSDPVTYTVTAEDGENTQAWSVTVTQVEQPLGLDGALDISVYPNPVADKLMIKTPEEVQISLTDLNGRVIIREKEGSLFEMDLSQLENGIYLLMIRSEDQVTSRRIIKEN
ncbi:BspA family leucine-rich repeat surface protein [Ekhidna sp.]